MEGRWGGGPWRPPRYASCARAYVVGRAMGGGLRESTSLRGGCPQERTTGDLHTPFLPPPYEALKVETYCFLFCYIHFIN